MTKITDWDDAYSNGAYIPNAEQFPPRWADQSRAFRADLGTQNRAEIDIRYGTSGREVYDLFFPKSMSKGLVVFVHGGYWMAFDKSSWSHLAAGALAQGYAVAMPSYTLAPNAHIAQITTQIAAAITHAATRVAGLIHLAGHSAGGHLVSRMLCQNTPLDIDTQSRITHVQSISGVHDLNPLLKTKMKQSLRLSSAEAGTESPALCAPIKGASLTAWVGANERPEFIRQNDLIATHWASQGANTRVVHAPNLHHFNVIDALADPNSEMVSDLLRGNEQ